MQQKLLHLTIFSDCGAARLMQGVKPPCAAQRQPPLSSGLPLIPALPVPIAPVRPWCAWGAVGVGDWRSDIPVWFGHSSVAFCDLPAWLVWLGCWCLGMEQLCTGRLLHGAAVGSWEGWGSRSSPRGPSPRSLPVPRSSTAGSPPSTAAGAGCAARPCPGGCSTDSCWCWSVGAGAGRWARHQQHLWSFFSQPCASTNTRIYQD